MASPYDDEHIEKGRYETDAAYFRRRADFVTDMRLRRLEDKVDGLDSKVDVLTIRLAIVGAFVSLTIIAANIIGPTIAYKLFGA